MKKHYYDTKYHGIDLEARYREFDEKIRSAGSLGHAFGTVAAFLDALNDSHTFFIPPMRPFRLDYGYRMQMFGENCFVTRMRPGTDAEGKIHPGDEVIRFNNYGVTRRNLWKLDYLFNSLSPQGASLVDILNADGKQEKLKIEAKMIQLKRVMDISSGAESDDLWKLIRDAENADHLVRQRWVEKTERPPQYRGGL